MVLAFSSQYNKDTNTQHDVILTQEKRLYRICCRTNFQSIFSKTFEKEEEAYAAFSVEEAVLG